MVAPASTLQVQDISTKDIAALRRKAKALGLSTEDYVKQLIQADLALDRKARNSSFAELAAPFRKALIDVDDPTIDRIVARARRRSSSRKR